MLGFDYTGQTYLAAFPLGKFIVDVLETLEVNDNIKTYAYHVLANLEEIELGDDVAIDLGQLLKVIESMNVSDDIKMSFMIVAMEMAIIYQKDIYPLVIFLHKEYVIVRDYLDYLSKLIIREIVKVLDILKINGKEIFEFWERCYEKATAVVENMYQKFRK